MSTGLREQLAAAIPELDHLLLFHHQGNECPPLNHSSVTDTYQLFCSGFLPRCPILDPRGRSVRIRKSNFPKFLNLRVRPGLSPKKTATIVESIEQGQFEESEYEWAEDRIKALFWVPDVIADPDAIYLKNRSAGVIQAEEVYVKVYDKTGSKIKLVFIDFVGKKRDPIFITSFLTNENTAKKHCKGSPLYRRKIEKTA